MSKHEAEKFEFPEVIQYWPDSLREEELAAQSEPSDKMCEDYSWEYLFNEETEN